MLDKILSGRKLILASASPRRRELLAGLGVDFAIDTGNTFEEVIPDGLPQPQVPEYMAKGKSHGFHRELQSDEIIITADTMVLCEDEIMGKPKDREDAVRMIEKLQDNTHTVYTGVCIRSLEKEVSFTVATDVRFGNLTPDEISYYIDTCKPFDKAGAYGVQEWIGYAAIKGIEGSYFNVVGLPVHRLYHELKNF
ncbi:MAG: septum formation protein Maf [Bacteroidales bacterium]|nr:septum formation protein Maf [Bacteroidales bacterium]